MTTIPNDTIVRIHSADSTNGCLAVVLGPAEVENDIYRVLVYRRDDGTLLGGTMIMHYHRSCLWSVTKPLDTIVRGVLDDIGARPEWKGYEHLVEAITTVIGDKDITICEIYYKIADRIGTNWHNIERRMRSAIVDIFENAEQCVLRRYFPGHENDHHLTNSQFVYSLARYIRKEYDHA